MLTGTVSLVKAVRDYFQIPASEMVVEWKKLNEKDKQDFDKWLTELGYTIERVK